MSVEVVTAKSVYVPAAGLETPAIVTVTASPALITLAAKSPGPIVSLWATVELGALVTMCHPPVVSVTSTPLTPVKVVLGSATVIVVAPAAVVVDAVKPVVYVADAPATNGEIASVTLLTDEPKLTVFVTFDGPTAPPFAAVVGVMKTATLWVV